MCHLPCFLGVNSIVCLYHVLLIYSSVDGHLGCFHLLVFVNNAPVNVGVQISVRVPAFSSFMCMSRSGIAGWYVNSVFNFLRNRHTVFLSGCTILHSHQQCTRVPISPHPNQYLLFSVFLIIAIPMGVQSHLIIVVTSWDPDYQAQIAAPPVSWGNIWLRLLDLYLERE